VNCFAHVLHCLTAEFPCQELNLGGRGRTLLHPAPVDLEEFKRRIAANLLPWAPGVKHHLRDIA